jgi:hypothetical protein
VGPIIAAIFSNCVTVAGVLWYGWDIGWLLFLYGIESLVIGAFNVRKIRVASAKLNSGKKSSGREFIKGSIQMNMSINGETIKNWGANEFMIFFATSYGVIVMTLMLLLVFLFPVRVRSTWGILLWLAGVMVQNYSEWRNYLSRGDYKKYTKAQQTLMPFLRILALSVPVIVGISTQNNLDKVPVLLAMVGVKLLLDLMLILKPSIFINVRYGNGGEVIRRS